VLAIHQQTHAFIVSYHAEHGVTPTHREIGDEFDIVNSAVWNRLNRLEEAGLITRMPAGRNIVLTNQEK